MSKKKWIIVIIGILLFAAVLVILVVNNARKKKSEKSIDRCVRYKLYKTNKAVPKEGTAERSELERMLMNECKNQI